MGLLRTFLGGLKALFQGRKLNQEMDEELRAYVDAAVEEKMRAGMSHAEALRAARVEIGSTDAVKQKVWSAGWESEIETIWQDIRYGLRVLRKSPGFTAVVVITLALGIGANTAIFSLINAIMLRTLPVRDPQSLVILRWTSHGPVNMNAHPSLVGWEGCPGDRIEACSFGFPTFQQFQAAKQVFSGVFGFLEQPGMVVNVNGRISRASGLLVTGDFFPTLGVRPALGRLLDPLDDAGESPPVAVISYRFWQNVLGGDRAVVGKSLLIGKNQFTIVGVTFPQPLQLDPGLATDLWVPLSSRPTPPKTTANFFWLQIMARLRPGVSLGQAAAASSTIFAASTTTGPTAMFAPTNSLNVELSPAATGESSLRHAFSRPLYVLLTAVTLVLLIACANIAGLMLARASARRKDIAVRSALGATRGRIIRQLLTESLLLSARGGITGIFLGNWGAQSLATFLTWNRTWFISLQVDVRPDARVLAFTALLSVIVGIVFGLFPGLSSGKAALVPALKEGTANPVSTSRGGQGVLGNTLVIVQIALAVLVLVGAGLLVRTMANLKAVNVGFDPQKVLLFSIDSTYSNRAGGGGPELLHRELQERLATLPGVISASYSALPLLSGFVGNPRIYAEDRPTTPISPNQCTVGPDFFKTMRIPLRAGRTFNIQDFDEKPSPSVVTYKPVVISKTLARDLFGDQPAVGRFFLMAGPDGPSSERRQVVGVVDDIRSVNLRDAIAPTMYVPVGSFALAFEVRTALDPKAMMPEVRTAINRFDPNLLITDMKSQMDQIDQNIYQERLIANLSSLFALLALIVACVGIYGLLSYQVTRRTQEIGIRLALGAQRGDVLRLIIRQGAILAVLGALIGTAAALAVTRYLQSFLFGVKPSDPLTIAAVAFGLIAVALFASYIPARRAMKTDPMVALRYE